MTQETDRKMRWQVALDTLSIYHTNAEIAEMVEASSSSVSSWRNRVVDASGAYKRALIEEAETRYPAEFSRMEEENDE